MVSFQGRICISILISIQEYLTTKLCIWIISGYLLWLPRYITHLYSPLLFILLRLELLIDLNIKYFIDIADYISLKN